MPPDPGPPPSSPPEPLQPPETYPEFDPDFKPDAPEVDPATPGEGAVEGAEGAEELAEGAELAESAELAEGGAALGELAPVAAAGIHKDAALDEALQRRLTLHLRLDVPEIAEREQLWRSFLPQGAPRDPDLDVAALAREFELTGGLIKNVVVRAAFLAAREDGRLGTGLLRRAATLELEDMGRVVRAA